MKELVVRNRNIVLLNVFLQQSGKDWTEYVVHTFFFQISAMCVSKNQNCESIKLENLDSLVVVYSLET
jgi:hypothetical protein